MANLITKKRIIKENICSVTIIVIQGERSSYKIILKG